MKAVIASIIFVIVVIAAAALVGDVLPANERSAERLTLVECNHLPADTAIGVVYARNGGFEYFPQRNPPFNGSVLVHAIPGSCKLTVLR